MSEIKVDTLTGKTTANDITVTVGATATQSLEQGLAKAWYNYEEYSITTVRDSFGISSIVNTTTADSTANFTNSFNNVGYSASILATCHPATHYSSAGSYANSNDTADGYFTSSHRYYIHNIGAGGIAATFVTGQFLGDLA